MTDEVVMEVNETDAEVVSRVYEIGYHISPATKEEDVEKVVSEIRSAIEKVGGTFIAEGAPSLTKLAYLIEVQEGGKRIRHDRAFFGWIKIEAPASAAALLEKSLKNNPAVIRSIVFRTVREETRARFKAQTLREVKRTDIIKVAPRVAEESAEPVSEEDLDKALDVITA